MCEHTEIGNESDCISCANQRVNSKSALNDGLCKLLAEWYDQGWRIERTSCRCGGSWAWLKETSRGTMKMYGCICHHVPDDKFT